ncbi:Ig-like domain-containing protein [Methylococcus sp. Mc7]|uniref:Ig-like domain-containing protein n=1 Tax=Methylococcus sp. Mc7 TaxID=2860258 RepID=UPI001C52C9D6|nr:Ig-like domain-containing protein [Methylococcus sp. Mc7]QXP83128.1 Ig-like domain-containing protein [Methylococcus sp. Mc7]
MDNGAVVFQVTDATAETIEFTVTDVTDGLTLAHTATVNFVVPPATSAGLSAFPTSVAADGISTTTLTITLKDALNRPTPGKTITLSQGSGHSIITGPNPPVTDANGQIQFTATDLVNETVTYSAVDVTDGDLPIPGNGVVTFSGSVGGCVTTLVPPVGANGNVVTPWANGFKAEDFFFGNVNWSGCPGASNPAFKDNAALVADFRTGDLFKLGLEGGAVSSANVIANLGPTLSQPVFGKDGRLYVTRGATTGNFTTGALYEIDFETGAILRTVAQNLTCPAGLAVDPLSGDLFFTDSCTGAGADNPSIFRVSDPAGSSPAVAVYAELPSTPNGGLAFAPNGTLYAVTGYFNNEHAPIVRIGGTNTSQPPAMTTLPGVTSAFGIAISEAQPNGEARSLIVHTNSELRLVDITTNPPTTTVLATGSIAPGVVGPDGCMYSSGNDRVAKLTGPGGSCGFLPTNPAPSLGLTPATVTPNPVQGGSQSFTANLNHVATPAGTPVLFTVSGANPQVKLVRSDAQGHAQFTYSAVFAGSDKVVAYAEVDGKSLTSNPARLTWAAGRHTTFLTLNPSPAGGTPGQPVTVVASLTDVSADPVAALADQTIEFTLDGATCSAVTDANGVAACQVTPDAVGMTTLSARFAGTEQLVPADAAIGFNVLAAAPLPSRPTVTISVSPATVALGGNATLTWSSTDAVLCTASGAWSGSQATSGSQNVSQAQPGVYTYTLACEGPGGSASNSATLTVESAGSIPFSRFSVILNVGQKAFELGAWFVLGPDSDGINPVTEAVNLRVGDYSATLPPGSFKQRRPGFFTLKGKVNGVTLRVIIMPSGGGTYELGVIGIPAQAVGSARKVDVELAIGNDGGRTRVGTRIIPEFGVRAD